ncbi:MAG TPA: hypothetical protein PLJ29_05580, partial [Leptospiraceae bacterium]|nr:hypothetical protein [Leptospiraceae bacterium]
VYPHRPFFKCPPMRISEQFFFMGRDGIGVPGLSELHSIRQKVEMKHFRNIGEPTGLKYYIII